MPSFRPPPMRVNPPKPPKPPKHVQKAETRKPPAGELKTQKTGLFSRLFGGKKSESVGPPTVPPQKRTPEMKTLAPKKADGLKSPPVTQKKDEAAKPALGAQKRAAAVGKSGPEQPVQRPKTGTKSAPTANDKEAARQFLSLPVSEAQKQFGFKTTTEYTKFVEYLGSQGLTPRSVGASDPSEQSRSRRPSVDYDRNYWEQKRSYQDFQATADSAFAAATYTGATAVETSVEKRSALTQAASNVSDFAQVIADVGKGGISPAIGPRRPPEQPGTLVGTREAKFRNDAARLIQASPNHPLRFLLDDDGNFKSTRGLTHSELANRPDLVQMGHVVSKKAGGKQIVLQGAWENQYSNVTIEHPGKNAARKLVHVENVAIDIGGLGVELETAKMWEKEGKIHTGTVVNARKIP